MYVYTVQQKDYDDYPMGNVIETVGPFDTWDEAYRHGQRTRSRYYCDVKLLTTP